MHTGNAKLGLTTESKSTTRAREWVCIFCENIFSVNYGWCPECGADKALVPAGENNSTAHTRFVKANDFEAPDVDYVPAHEWAPAFPRGIPSHHIILLRGLPGAGKSRLAMRLISQIGNAAIASLERTAADQLNDAREAGANLRNLSIVESYDSHTLEQAEQFDALMIDSVQKIGGALRSEVKKIQRFAHEGHIVIAISQSNARGGTRGGLELEYDLADTVAMVRGGRKPGTAQVVIDRKNRAGPLCRFSLPIMTLHRIK